ncbi:methionine ABC transporter ATP-binding protein [Pluralibacter gergoviae]|uniref:ATP-binding cassette domain-containing protein n=1 Tax=Pluralibacter gergoviae TaxID=61647 RepID=UPI0004F7008E|nr:ATP-binding cassette domain-containing protein [Pluralibacter gergoviae]AIR00083.1 methionine ABC transporter ATP-binding protein [Pluralibacter gergoviae]
MIDIDRLHKGYRTADGGHSEVLRGLSLQVPARSVTAVVGPSGAGKSTLARCISLLERPDSGSIRVNGEDLSLLSGGQRQRIGIARALALRPSVLLADEATSGLDPQATASVLALLRRLRDEYRLAIVLITHEMDAVRAAADAVAEIRDGRIVQYGDVGDLLAQPDSALAAQLLPLSAASARSDLLLRLSYRRDVPVATDWISRLSQQYALGIDLLGGHVEILNGRLVGRLQAGVRFQGQRLPVGRLLELLAGLGIAAEILDGAPALREAV